MKKMKIISIGAVVLMAFVAFVPVNVSAELPSGVGTLFEFGHIVSHVAEMTPEIVKIYLEENERQKAIDEICDDIEGNNPNDPDEESEEEGSSEEENEEEESTEKENEEEESSEEENEEEPPPCKPVPMPQPSEPQENPSTPKIINGVI